jgi:hypothetical protein
MAITTINQKLAVMEWEDYAEPALPLSPGALGQDDQQQLLWGYPGVLWAEPVVGTATASRLLTVLGVGG